MAFQALLKYFPVPKTLSFPSIGVELTPDYIRFIELAKDAKKYRVERFGSIPIPKGDINEDEFPSGEKLKLLVEEFRIKNKLGLIHAALPEEKAYIFKIDIAKASPEEIREGIELRLEEFVPVHPKEAVFDYQILRELPNDRLSISVTVMPEPLVMRYLDFFVSAGLTPVSFQLSAQSISNAVISAEDKTPAVIVNFGREKTGLYLVSDNSVHFTSTVPVGSESLTEAIKKNFSVSTKEAEKIKEEKGIGGARGNTEVFSSLIATLSSIRDEVERLTDYWQSHVERYSETKQNIDKIILCGKESSLEGMQEYFESSLNMKTELANVWINAFSIKEYIPPIARNDSLDYASVIGLALNK